MFETHKDVRKGMQLDPCGSPDHEDRGLRMILDRLGEEWTVKTIAELATGPRRYRELERALSGISQRMLNHYFRWPELRATAWSVIFDDIARDFRRDGEAPEQALDRFFAETFADEARPIWRLWIEAENLAAGDPGLAAALAVARTALRRGMTELLSTGCASGAWSIGDPAATALRLEAMRDGLAGMILSGDSEVDATLAEHHLRTVFDMERLAL